MRFILSLSFRHDFSLVLFSSCRHASNNFHCFSFWFDELLLYFLKHFYVFFWLFLFSLNTFSLYSLFLETPWIHLNSFSFFLSLISYVQHMFSTYVSLIFSNSFSFFLLISFFFLLLAPLRWREVAFRTRSLAARRDEVGRTAAARRDFRCATHHRPVDLGIDEFIFRIRERLLRPRDKDGMCVDTSSSAVSFCHIFSIIVAV